MKIVLINPPYTLQERYSEHISKKVTYTLPPLGIVYIAAVLEKKNHNISIIDAQAYDYSNEQVVKKASEYNPDIIGFYTITPTLYIVLDIAKKIKELNPHIKIILGGPHASGFPQEIIDNNPAIDFIVIGEGELTISELVDKIENNLSVDDVNGICYRKRRKAEVTKAREFIHNLDTLPFPARHLLPVRDRDKYRPLPSHYRKLPVMHMICSRGCIFRCTFCSSKKIFGGTYRTRSPENVIGRPMLRRRQMIEWVERRSHGRLGRQRPYGGQEKYQ